MISQLAAQVPDLVAFPLVGLLAGLAIGLTGMGGGVLLTPIMVLFLGVPPNVAVSNDLLISLAVKPVGALTHSRAGTVRSDMVLRLAVGSVPAAFLGALLVNTWFADRADAMKYLIGGTLLVAAAMMIVRLLGRTRSVEEASLPVRTVPTVAIGVVGGLLVGMTSVGSGSCWCFSAPSTPRWQAAPWWAPTWRRRSHSSPPPHSATCCSATSACRSWHRCW